MRDGAFFAPALVDVLVDRIASTAYPSERWIASAAVSAVTVEQLDRVIDAVGRSQFQLHLSPRRMALLGMITNRRILLSKMAEGSRRAAGEEGGTDADHSSHSSHRSAAQLERAVALLDQTSELLT